MSGQEKVRIFDVWSVKSLVSLFDWPKIFKSTWELCQSRVQSKPENQKKIEFVVKKNIYQTFLYSLIYFLCKIFWNVSWIFLFKKKKARKSILVLKSFQHFHYSICFLSSVFLCFFFRVLKNTFYMLRFDIYLLDKAIIYEGYLQYMWK